MSNLSKISYLYKEITKALKNPSLFNQLLNKKYLDIVRGNVRVGKAWSNYGNTEKFDKRLYASYEDYLTHQQNKLQYINLIDAETEALLNYDIKYREVLRERLKSLEVQWPGKNVLCLAARLGTEVKAFLDLGCFAVGIDINPGKNNLYVLYGDFHDLQFPSSSTDVIFSNSLDHVFSIEKLIDEIKRVLKKDGLLILEVQKGREEGRTPGFYESFWWSKIDDLVSYFNNRQLRLLTRVPLDYPWEGEQLSFAAG